MNKDQVKECGHSAGGARPPSVMRAPPGIAPPPPASPPDAAAPPPPPACAPPPPHHCPRSLSPLHWYAPWGRPRAPSPQARPAARNDTVGHHQPPALPALPPPARLPRGAAELIPIVRILTNGPLARVRGSRSAVAVAFALRCMAAGCSAGQGCRHLRHVGRDVGIAGGSDWAA